MRGQRFVGRVNSGQDRTELNRTGQKWTGTDRTEMDRTEVDWSGQVFNGQERIGQAGTKIPS